MVYALVSRLYFCVHLVLRICPPKKIDNTDNKSRRKLRKNSSKMNSKQILWDFDEFLMEKTFQNREKSKEIEGNRKKIRQK